MPRGIPKSQSAKKDTKFKKGHKGGPGRPQGSRNKLSESYFSRLQNALEKLTQKQVDKWARDNVGECMRLIGTHIPRDFKIAGTVNHEHTHSHETVSKTDEWIKSVIGDGSEEQAEEPTTH